MRYQKLKKNKQKLLPSAFASLVYLPGFTSCRLCSSESEPRKPKSGRRSLPKNRQNWVFQCSSGESCRWCFEQRAACRSAGSGGHTARCWRRDEGYGKCHWEILDYFQNIVNCHASIDFVSSQRQYEFCPCAGKLATVILWRFLGQRGVECQVACDTNRVVNFLCWRDSGAWESESTMQKLGPGSCRGIGGQFPQGLACPVLSPFSGPSQRPCEQNDIQSLGRPCPGRHALGMLSLAGSVPASYERRTYTRKQNPNIFMQWGWELSHEKKSTFKDVSVQAAFKTNLSKINAQSTTHESLDPRMVSQSESVYTAHQTSRWL